MLPQTTSRGLYTVKIFPSGDFSGGRLSSPPNPDRDEDTHPLSGIHVVETKLTGQTKVYFESRSPQSRSTPLGYSGATNSHKVRTKRGQKGITGLGKRKTRSAAAVFGKAIRRNCTTFATFTVPTVTKEENELICQKWSELIRQLKQEIMRSLRRGGVTNPDYFYVSEIQEKRYQSHGLLTLHLHMVFQGRNYWKDNWVMSKSQARDIWRRLLENLLGRCVNCDQATRVESPRGSLVAELGKYLSKGGKILSEVKQRKDNHLLPPSYWGVSRSLNKKIKLAMRVLVGDSATWFLDSLRDFGDLIKYRMICLEQYGGICVGWSGYIMQSDLLDKLLV